MHLEQHRRIIPGVWLLAQEVHSDARGDLIAFEQTGGPFVVKRVFAIRSGRACLDRGGHANSCHELIVAMSGAVTVAVDNGFARAQVRLASPSEAIWIQPGVVIALKKFAPQTVLIVSASQSYATTSHYGAAIPDLFAEALV